MNARKPITVVARSHSFSQPTESVMPVLIPLRSVTTTHKPMQESARLMLAMFVLTALTGCSEPKQAAWSGYAEGDYVYVSSPLGGRVDALLVVEGDVVQSGQPLFTLDAAAERAALVQAQAQLAAARASQANTAKGRRPDELAVTQAQLAQAKAQALQAVQSFDRQATLVKQGFASAATLDSVSATRDQTAARVSELRAALRVARLPARQDEQTAAEAQVQAARQAVEQAQWRLDQKRILAPVSATVSDVMYRQGEVAPAAQPVLALLPPSALKALFFVPEDQLARIRAGDAVTVTCDACGDALQATVTRVATSPEFTPPVIYSNVQRAKLVYRVEARVAGTASVRLHPGQPIDVSLPRRAAP